MAYFSYLLQRARLASRQIVKNPPSSGFFFRLMMKLGFGSVGTAYASNSSFAKTTSSHSDDLKSLRRLIKEVSAIDDNQIREVLYEIYEFFAICMLSNEYQNQMELAISRLLRRLGPISVKVNKNP